MSSQEDEVCEATRATRSIARTSPLIDTMRGIRLGQKEGVPTHETDASHRPCMAGVDLAPVKEELRLDASRAIKVATQGTSQSVSHMRRARGIEAAFLSQYWGTSTIGEGTVKRKVIHERGEDLTPDIETKSVGAQRLEILRPQMGIIYM